MTDEQMLESLKKLPADYIKVCWPNGDLRKTQKTEIELAFYAGMAQMFGEMNNIMDRVSEDEEAAAMELERFVNTIIEEAQRLNGERFNQ